MNLQDLKDRKRDLQNEIYLLCKKFTNETGVKCDVNFKGYALDTDHLGNKADSENFLNLHPVDVKLHI